jgi:hypothetical protein
MKKITELRPMTAGNILQYPTAIKMKHIPTEISGSNGSEYEASSLLEHCAT